MFRRLSEPLPLSEASLLALRPALNAPVLTVEFLPVGPARAAVVAFGEEWGGIALALGIRSVETGQVAVFRNQESIAPDVPVATALEKVLAQAERMGFLFDEDMVEAAGQGRSEALALWGRLMGDIELPPPPRAVAPEPAACESVLVGEAPEPAHPLPPARPLDALDQASGGPPPAARPASEVLLDERVPEFDLGVEGVVVATPTAADDGQPTQPIQRAAAPPPAVERRAPPAVSPEKPARAAASASAPTAPTQRPSRRAAKSATPAPARPTARVESAPPPEPPPARVESAPPSERPRVRVESAPPASRRTPVRDPRPPASERASALEQAPPRPKLSKFRHVDEAVAATTSTPGIEESQPNELGRIPLVRVRKEGAKRVTTIARLLSSF